MIAFQNKKQKRTIIATILSVVAIISWIFMIYGFGTDQAFLGLFLGVIPYAAIVLVKSFDDLSLTMILMICSSFFIPVLAHYTNEASTGMILDGMIIFNLFVVLCHLARGQAHLSHVSFDVLFAIFIWFTFCFIELFNPRMLKFAAWFSSIRSMAGYFFFIMLIAMISLDSVKSMRKIMYAVAAMIIISSLKSMYQMYIGWTPGDLYFLNVMDGRRTHIIYYGTRYFSIFSDAANFGGCMGMCLAIYMILGFHARSFGERVFWWITAGFACYGMFVSGTRSALVVPVASIMMYVVLIKDVKKIIFISVITGSVVALLAFTTIGASYASIRRARTIFNHKEDLSYQIRKTNQDELRILMKDLPLGNSLGMSGGRGEEYGDESPIDEIPTDSWFVQIWVETGKIGQYVYFAVMIYLFVKAGIIVFFRLKNEEIRGWTSALLSGVAGLFVMSSNNEVFSQIPNAVLVYTFMAMIYLSPMYEKELELKEQKPIEIENSNGEEIQNIDNHSQL